MTILYGPMYMNLDDFPAYSDSLTETFETKINRNLQFCHGYPKIR